MIPFAFIGWLGIFLLVVIALAVYGAYHLATRGRSGD